jgi:hypothetical protein
MGMTMSGGCQCGAIRYRLVRPPFRASLCHCRMCQKAVGQPFAAFAMVKLPDLAWTRGDPPTFRSSTAAERRFCPACGTSLTFRYLHTDEIGVAIGTLDEPARVRPDLHYGVESRLPWLAPEFLDGLPRETTGAPGVSAQVRTLVNFQHPDHDTPDGWTPPQG